MNPSESLHSITEINAANVDAARSLALAAVAATERLATLNADFVRASIERSGELQRIPTGVSDWQDIAARQNSVWQETAERAAAWFHGVCDATREAQSIAADLVSARFTEAHDSMGSVIDKLTENGPAGSGAASQAMRSAFAGNRLAYDTMVGMTKKMTEANMAAINAVGAMGATAARKTTARKAA